MQVPPAEKMQQTLITLGMRLVCIGVATLFALCFEGQDYSRDDSLFLT